jgi:UDP-4-amino-4,6-dideoxy-N-acetyl-beta-L-altrosamine N-acetyltransferase
MNLVDEANLLSFLDLRRASRDVTDTIRAIRNEPEVRRNMYTDHEITPDEHSRWLAGLNEEGSDRRFFAVYRGHEVVGGVGVSAVNGKHRRAEWAFYLTSRMQGHGTGAALEYRFLTFFFEEYPTIHKLNCEVIEFNAAVVKLHKRFGFVEEGVRRHHVARDGQTYGAVLLGITRDEWAVARADLTKRLFAAT